MFIGLPPVEGAKAAILETKRARTKRGGSRRGRVRCQLRRGNIIVDFFTARASERANEALDRLGALLLALAMGLLAWRSAIGGLNAWNSGAGSMMLGFPEWVVYCGMVPPLALAAVIGLAQALRGFGSGGQA